MASNPPAEASRSRAATECLMPDELVENRIRRSTSFPRLYGSRTLFPGELAGERLLRSPFRASIFTAFLCARSEIWL